MKYTYFTCGPSQLYPGVFRHLQIAFDKDIPSLSHRSKIFQQIYKSTQDNLRKLLSIPKSHKIFFVSSSLESMEKIIQNCVEKNSFHFVNGAFSRKFYQFAEILKKQPIKYEVPEGEGYLPEKVMIPPDTELICVMQNETSTGVAIPVQSINRLYTQNPKSLIAVDIVSSAPYVELNFNKIDLTFFSVQKGFGLPAGMGVLIINEEALAKAQFLRKKGINVGSYHSFSSLLEKDQIFQTPETPNVLLIYLLGQVCKDILKKGMNMIREETEAKAKLVYDFFDKHPRCKPFVKNSNYRSKTTIAIDVMGDTNKIVKKLKSKGIVVSSGYGKFKESHIRIANFPAHSAKDFTNLVRYLNIIS
ncbi:hypothetical protein A2767_06340 [Candidatus Roizmanbacteria bacterium RIFCSPHIGHO2_01_FULL_35_10]|uniref:phosphoserine transaminase n=1 Tax=Candidatus Roizmanbacteria bacterium RIFCSPLOWO2_01_FULL_35_13 TaxID=1802055 RepID=A0A1F7IFE8_9BACT|nr:MAG: hypothetical protein A2767_06340 [Candidatus Roizmanbacteria bacterium RIFCSPHIGHO2_01_FULL_35_10]OGK42096.1 MAG: hypothetical protein A3A74_04990 [Candidatus Roizmanbacteria bacterium RIFCSPLOWO2_01_FULL_35_13]